MKPFLFLLFVVLSMGIVIPSYAQLYNDYPSSSSTTSQQIQVQPTDKGSVKVGFYTDPQTPDTANQTKLYISFLNKDSGSTQQHIDYKVFIKKGTDQIFGIPLTHTAEGTVTIPFQFTDVGSYQIGVEVDGILFQPIPPETATFTVGVGSSAVPEFPHGAAMVFAGILLSIVFISTRMGLRTRINT